MTFLQFAASTGGHLCKKSLQIKRQENETVIQAKEHAPCPSKKIKELFSTAIPKIRIAKDDATYQHNSGLSTLQ